MKKVELGRELRSHRPTLAETGWLLGISSRWAGELTRGGHLPAGGTMADQVRAWTRYQAEHRRHG